MKRSKLYNIALFVLLWVVIPVWFGSCTAFVATVALAEAQDLVLLEQSMDVNFRETITFTARVTSPTPLEKACVVYELRGRVGVRQSCTALDEIGDVYTLKFVVNLKDTYYPPGTEVTYSFRVTPGGTIGPFEGVVMDQRHEWQCKENDVVVCWYKGGAANPEGVYNSAVGALPRLKKAFGIDELRQIKVFLYSQGDLLGALPVNSQKWTGGMAFSDLQIILQSGGAIFAETAVVHEIVHIMTGTYRNIYMELPSWFEEGLAVYYSNELDKIWRGYRGNIADAVKKEKLIPLTSLNSSFPADPERTKQSYAQSGMVVEWMVNEFGEDAIRQILAEFHSGLTLDEALMKVVGLDTVGIDNAWRRSLGLASRVVTQDVVVLQEPEPAEPQPAFETFRTITAGSFLVIMYLISLYVASTATVEEYQK